MEGVFEDEFNEGVDTEQCVIRAIYQKEYGIKVASEQTWLMSPVQGDKFVLTKSEMYIGKGYKSDGLFKLNIMIVIPKINKINTSNSIACLLESSYL